MTTQPKMKHRTTTKQDALAMIKSLETAGLKVTKDSLGGYWVRTKGGIELFVALPGRYNWLVSYVPDLFSREPELS